MNKDFILNIVNDMNKYLTVYQVNKLEESLTNIQTSYRVIKLDNKEQEQEVVNNNSKLVELYISSKKIEGCSDRTITYYKEIINDFISSKNILVKDIETNDIRYYLAKRKEETNCSGTTIDNIRRVLSSFFSWLEDEDYIIKSPVRRIHKIKTQIVVKEVFTDEDIVTMIDNCKNVRDLALIEFLISTGVRVGEIVNINKSDINFEDRSCIVLGKGNKQREVYFDAKTKIHLEEYLNSRDDNESGLFVSLNKPHQRLTISAVELIVRKLGEKTNINKVHPHKFRRTLATMAIDKGMPIEQVQKLLGHVKIETTMHYAMVNQNNIKISHRKFIS